MGHSTRLLIVALAIFFGLAGRLDATTYYIAANGSDSNTGTINTSPWLHAPGMPNCTGNCAKTIPQPGDKFIFRGGDTWHLANSSASPYTGGTWVWQWSGGSSNCNYPTATSSCIYIGTDQTWYSGTSFTRPKLNFDNPTSTSLVSSCAYSDLMGVNIGNGSYRNINYVIFDDFELYGKCWSAASPNNWIWFWGIYDTFTNNYFHGWTETTGLASGGDEDPMIAGDGQQVNAVGGVTHNVYAYNVFDGSDSYCTGLNTCSGGPMIANDQYDVEHNVCRWMTNCISGTSNNLATAHDNLFEYIYGSWDGGTHTNVLEMNGQQISGSNVSIYNNTIRHINVGMILDVWVPSGGAAYVFNNVIYDLRGGAGVNCMQVENANPSAAASVYFTNNTVDHTASTCMIRPIPGEGQVWNGTVYFQNLHSIGSITSVSQMESSCGSGNTCTWIDNGNEVFQTESVANGQGYTSSNNYQPTAISNATYHAGGNLSSSCSTYSSDSALCSGSTGGVTNTAGSGADPILSIPSPLLRGTTWDAGAYQYSGLTSSLPNAPTGLVASVQ